MTVWRPPEHEEPLRSISEAFAHDDPNCANCAGDGSACEEHPDLPQSHLVDGVECGWPGIPCPVWIAMHS